MNNEFLRHTVATLAYRASKTIRGAPAGFASFSTGTGVRTPGAIVAHMGDLFDWALALAEGKHVWKSSEPLDWESGGARFFAALEAFDARLASEAPLRVSAEKLFQGPIADALTHVGQIAMLRRMAEAPCRGENYFVASIESGRVGFVQSGAVVEFD
jgi:hypothetical protein